MKKQYGIFNLQKALKLIFFFAFLILNSVVSGQSYVADDKYASFISKLSDNPQLKLSADKKNWPPISSPLTKQPINAVSVNPHKTIEYDLISRKIDHSHFSGLETAAISNEAKLPSEQFYGDWDPGDQLNTIFAPDNRIKISPTIGFPWRTICKLYITFPDGNHFVGSGALIGRSDRIGFHCLTAGHCVYRQEYGGWAESVEIIPALDNDYTPFYSAWAIKIKTSEGWITDARPEYDWACITLDRQIGNFTGWMDRFTINDLKWYTRLVHGAGYPTDLDFGLCLYYQSDSGRVADKFFHWYSLDASSGQDGMPIWAMDGNRRRIISIHIGDDNGSGSNRGLRLNEEKYKQVYQWIHDDQPPVDYPDLIDDGPKWSDFEQDTVVRGYSQLNVWNDIRNIGTAYSGSVTIAYYASRDDDIEPDKDYLIGTKEFASIPPFTWRDAEWSGKFPEPIPSGKYYIGWIIDPENRVVEFDEANNQAVITRKTLTVLDPYITLSIPNGGEVFVIGEKNLIKWATIGGSGLVTVDISFDNGGSWQNLVTNLPDTGGYRWNIPLSQKPALTCLMKVTDPFKDITVQSKAAFMIETRPTVPGVPQDEGAFTSKAKVTFSWTAATDPETGISSYQIQVGTQPGGNDMAEVWINDVLSYNFTGSHNQKLYARVRAQNSVGLTGPWSISSDGILIDLTPPFLQGGPVDEGEFSGTDSVLFKWNPAVDEESGVIMNYKLQVGTAIGFSDIFDKWINRKLQYRVAGKHGQTLYARIKVHNAAIGVSDWSDWSDGITIDLTPPAAPGKPCSEALTVNYSDIPFFWDPAIEDISEVVDYHFKVIDLNDSHKVVFDQWVGNKLQIIITTKDGQSLLGSVQAQNNAGLIGSWASATEPVQVQLTPALLTLIKSSPAYAGEGWDNAIDNDIIDWDGTVSAEGTYSPHPYAIFGFAGGGTGQIEKVKLLTDTRVGFPKRWVTHFSVQYSITGIEDKDFIELVEGRKQTGNWEEFSFPAQTVKFIKLIIQQPTIATTEFCQVGEFQVFGRSKYVPTELVDLQITKGSVTDPAEAWDNAIDGDIHGWDGTVSVMTGAPPAYVIFNFLNQSLKTISRIRLLTNTGVGFSYRWLREFHIEVSTTGIEYRDFTPVFSARKIIGDWESFNFDPVAAKYVKLVLDRPHPEETDYCQIGEIEIYSPKATTLPLQSGTGISNTPSGTLPLALVELPQSYQVGQNFPNPFNPETTIRYQLPEDAKVSLKIYNMMGQEITTLIEGLQPAGYHSAAWTGRDSKGDKVPTGVYLYQLRAGNFNVTKKMILVE